MKGVPFDRSSPATSNRVTAAKFEIDHSRAGRCSFDGLGDIFRPGHRSDNCRAGIGNRAA